MEIVLAFKEALESINANKMRAGLTILGIVIGVAAVIAMLAVGAGAQDTILGSISGIGTNLLFVFEGNTQVDIVNEQPLTMADAAALGDVLQAPHIEAVAPVVSGNLPVIYEGESTTPQVYGVTPEFQSVRNYGLIEGSFITDENVNGRASVALIGPDVADKLFGRQTLVTGETIRIDGQPFRVIGVLESKGGGSFGSQDNIILVPITTARVRLLDKDRDNVDTIYIQALSSDAVPAASEEISQILSSRHHTKVGEDDFTIYSQEDFLSLAGTITNVLTIFLGGIAAISLLVGGIGIMNIMLVSVTERTREIGIRMAIGARTNDILYQFLVEAVVLSCVGGILGIVGGYLLSNIIGHFVEFKPVVSNASIIVSILFSAAVGIFFGLYPAWKASKLDPIEAFRYE
ncbi:MAG TPA: ABC transporter permease [Candidatus Riflebacteria bacterium]|nr:ABC transporter permease [Candidatus Riflebacteria bacterium]